MSHKLDLLGASLGPLLPLVWLQGPAGRHWLLSSCLKSSISERVRSAASAAPFLASYWLSASAMPIHIHPPLSRVINAYLNPLKAADEPWHCAGRVDAALYCTVLYCIVLDCTVQGVVMLEIPGSSNKDLPWSAWRLVNHYSAVLRQ